MNANNIIADPAQTYLTWVDGDDSGSVGYLGKKYLNGPDTNPAVVIKELGDDAGTVTIEFNGYNTPGPITLTNSTLDLAKVAAENALNEAGLLDFVVSTGDTLTGLNEDGTTLTFVVKSTTPWTFASEVGWATASPSNGNVGGEVTVTVADNAGAARTGVITFSNGAVTKSFTLGQLVNA